MTDLPNLKLKTLVSFPSRVNGGVGIDVTREQGAYTIDMDWGEFSTQTAIPTSPTNNVLTYDTSTGSYVMVPSQLLGGAVAGISDAPVDGTQYVRQSGAWATSAFLQAGAGAVTRTTQNKVREIVSVKDFGAVGNGIADDTAAINAALALGGAIYVPPGIYPISGQLNISVSKTKLFGDSLSVATIIATTASAAMLVISEMFYVEISGLTLDRSVTAVSGGDGIVCLGEIGQALFADLHIDHQHRGMLLGGTQQSMARYISITNCESHGLLMRTSALNPQLQWFLDTIGIGTCGGSGFYVDTSAGNDTSFLNAWRNCFTYANSRYGIELAGSAAAPIADLRVSGGFFGADGLGEINIVNAGAAPGAAGGDHQIVDCFFESAGAFPTGPGALTPPTNTGIAIAIDASVVRVTISNNRISAMSGPGIDTSAAQCIITGNKITDNAQAGASAGTQAGIVVSGGRATITGNLIGDQLGPGTQNIGIAVAVDNGHVIVGNDLNGNLLAPIYPNTLPLSVVAYNSPVAGNIGDYVSSTIALGSALALTASTPLNVTQISLPPGEWDVDAVINFVGQAATLVAYVSGGLATTSAFLDFTNGRCLSLWQNNAAIYNNIAGSITGVTIPPLRFSLTGTTPIYMVAQSLFSGGTSSAFGVLRARRVRY